jgi:aminomethyltransferase
MEHTNAKVKQLGNNEEIFICRSGYTGEDGFEISVRNEAAAQLCELILA